MSKKSTYVVISLIGCIAMAIYGCKQSPKDDHIQSLTTFSVKGSVREMTISHATPEFPEHEGKAEFISYCAICHSLKYITMQPDFSRKTWDAEVHKMIEKFGAPIDTVISKRIVDYLVAIKSPKAP